MASDQELFFQLPKPFLQDRSKACLLGGAIGDALGAPVEFMSLAQIRAKYGPRGIQAYDEAYGRIGAITDDTQMTLFSAEGIIRAKVRGVHRGICHPPSCVGYAYQRWLHTQGEPCSEFAVSPDHPGWLLGVRELHSRRAPGMTCLSALRIWKHNPAENDSKGCGTVMRSAPFGFVEGSWELAWECAEITHGHLEAKVSSAILARTIYNLLIGMRLKEALANACAQDDRGSLSSKLTYKAIELSEFGGDPDEDIQLLGQGWVAEEALAIGAYCALRSMGDFDAGIRMAVNHDGDSDSTGSICGNLLGAELGLEAIDPKWLRELELREVIEQVAVDLVTEVPVAPWDDPTPEQRYEEEAFWNRYPGC